LLSCDFKSESYLDRRASELQANLDIARAGTKAFESFVHGRHFMPNTLKQFSPAAILTGTFLLFLGPFLIVELSPVQLEVVFNRSTYLVFHNITEFFSMMVSFSLFGVGWYSYNQSRDHRALFLGVGFLAVGLVDFMHTMSNAAMPAFITANSTNKSTQFWITARLLDSSALLISSYVYPGTQNRWLTKKYLMTAALAVSGLVFASVIFFPSYLPATAIQGVGLTPLKRYAEFLVILFLAAAGVSYWKRMKRTGDRRLLYFLAAIIISVFSEAVFASYMTGFDTYNVLGHIYKVVAFYLIYKGVFAMAIEKPYVALSKANEKLMVEIAERKHAEQEVQLLNRELEQRVAARTADLRNSEARYRSVVENNMDAILITKPDGSILSANPEACHMFGMTEKEIMAGRRAGILSPDDPLIQKAREEGERAGRVRAELILARKDGSKFSADLSSSVFTDIQGDVMTSISIRDITERKRAEEALQQSRERLDLALVSSRMATFEWDIVKNKRIWSEGVHRLLGTKPETFTGEAEEFFQIIHPEDRNTVQAALARAIETTGVYETEYRAVWPDDSIRYIAARGYVHHNNAGFAVSMTGVCWDTTDRRQAEEALREREEQLRKLVNNTSAVILRVDPHGVITFANSRALKFFGFSKDELIGKHAVGTIIPEMDTTGRDLAAMVDEISSTPDRFHSNANENMRKNGERVWMEWTNSGIYDGDSRLKEFLAVGIDATERKQFEKELQESELRLKLAINTAHIGIYDINLVTQELNWDSQTKKFWGLPPEYLVDNRTFLAAIHPEDLENVKSALRLAKDPERGGHFEHEYRVIGLNDNIERWVAVYGQVFFENKNPVRLLGTALDITGEKLAKDSLKRSRDELEDKVRERTIDLQNLTEELERHRDDLRKLSSELVMAEEWERKRIAGVLHDDIAQTLAAIRMRLDMFQCIPSDQEHERTLKEVKALLLQTIKDTRALMTDIGNPVLFELGLKAACESLAGRMMERHPVRISCDIRDAFKSLTPDAKAILYQVVRELLNNIVKHSKATNAHVIVDMETGQCHLKVTDNGVGFDPQLLGPPSIEGGFGLYSLRERLTAMRGGLRIKSTPGTGTEVTATLPAELNRSHAPQSEGGKIL
jgi:PAS domain S-box-containing protein